MPGPDIIKVGTVRDVYKGDVLWNVLNASPLRTGQVLEDLIEDDYSAAYVSLCFKRFLAKVDLLTPYPGLEQGAYVLSIPNPEARERVYRHVQTFPLDVDRMSYDSYIERRKGYWDKFDASFWKEEAIYLKVDVDTNKERIGSAPDPDNPERRAFLLSRRDGSGTFTELIGVLRGLEGPKKIKVPSLSSPTATIKTYVVAQPDELGTFPSSADLFDSI